MVQKYRVIYKICASEKEAGRVLKTIKDKAREPYILYRPLSKSWLVVLCNSENREEADKAYAWFRNRGMEIALQKA